MKKIIIAGLLMISVAYATTANNNIDLLQAYTAFKTQSTAKITSMLDELTPDEKSALEANIENAHKAETNPLSIVLYKPTYILPYYYTGSPDAAVYQGTTPGNQKLMNSEFKVQLSLMVPIFHNLFYDANSSLDIAYSQLSYWQVYADSQYFRETNYEPEIFYENHFHRNWLLRLGADHQSNGRGATLERSWNRAIAALQFSGDKWLVGLKVWGLIFKASSIELHNPDIAYYLGHDNLVLSYRIKKLNASLELQNLESGLHRGFVQFSLSYPVSKHILLFSQYFNGYGQSLIEYNHRTQSVGVGLGFNDWMS